MAAYNNWPYIINLGNSIIGVALLAMPFCFKQCGILLGMLVLLFCTWLTLASCQLLMKAGISSRRKSYEFLAYHTHGASGKLITEVGMIGMQLGTLIAQIVVIGDLGPAIISKYFSIENSPGLRTFFIMLLCLSVGLPLGLLKNLRSVSRASTVCITFYCIFVVYVLYLSLPTLWSGAWYPNVYFWRPQGLFQCLPILSFSFGCQTQLFLVYDALPEPSLKAISGVISSAVNLCAVAYLLVGFFGYITFYSQEIPGDIIAIFPSTFFADMMKLCFVFSIVITFPVIIFPCRASIYTLIFAKKLKSHDDVMDPESFIPEHLFKLITICIVIGSMITGILIPNVEFILGLNGAITGTMICYIFPALFFLRVMGTKPDGKKVAQMVLWLGITILLVSTYATLRSQDKVHVQELSGVGNVDIVKNGQIEKPDLPVIDNKADFKDNADNVEAKRQEPPIPDPPDSLEKMKDVPDNELEKVKEKKAVDDQKAAAKVEIEAEEKKKDGENLEKEKKLEEGEKKQAAILAELEKQKAEQADILRQQREVLKELKDHHEHDLQKDLAVQRQAQENQAQLVANQQQPVPQQQQQLPQQQQQQQVPQQPPVQEQHEQIPPQHQELPHQVAKEQPVLGGDDFVKRQGAPDLPILNVEKNQQQQQLPQVQEQDNVQLKAQDKFQPKAQENFQPKAQENFQPQALNNPQPKVEEPQQILKERVIPQAGFQDDNSMKKAQPVQEEAEKPLINEKEKQGNDVLEQDDLKKLREGLDRAQVVKKSDESDNKAPYVGSDDANERDEDGLMKRNKRDIEGVNEKVEIKVADTQIGNKDGSMKSDLEKVIGTNESANLKFGNGKENVLTQKDSVNDQALKPAINSNPGDTLKNIITNKIEKDPKNEEMRRRM